MLSIFHSMCTHIHTQIHTHKHTQNPGPHIIIFSEKFTESLRIERYCLIYFQKLGRFYFLGVIYIPPTQRACAHMGQNIYNDSLQKIGAKSILNHMSLALCVHKLEIQIKTILRNAVVQSLSCVQSLCEPMDCSPPDSSVHGTSQARILECIAISFSRGSSRPRV